MHGAVDVLQRGDDALATLLALWKKHRDEELAACIELLGARCEVAPLPTDAWIDRAALGCPRQLNQLVDSFRSVSGPRLRERALGFEFFEPDPRIARALTDLIREPPFYGPTMRSFWRDVFSLLARHGDRNTLASIEPIRAGYRGRVGGRHAERFLEDLCVTLLA